MLSYTAIALVLGFTSVCAIPTKQPELDDIQCRCLTFSTSAAPTHCIYQELLTLDWDTAYSLALANDLKIQFASDKTISKVLSIPRPLPTSVLEAVQEGETLPLDPSKKLRSENRLICGFGDEVEHVGDGRGLKPEIHYVGTVLGLFMLLFIIYLIGEYIWTTTLARTRGIRLEGDEKALTAEYQALSPSASPTKSEYGSCTASSDCH
ncbi:uncharacterized protein SETTUDRAFT_99171 [Exserohilum turcica Et28A]|uniref:Uncharacterized protein n=1 Tax=Exserohilum turcicum (strain 28A) TaxID=671987 RepID=R0JVY4_EXST2|nr:uncharacterized protein SETTUDRAFT_99171 [Exserohilum turcica Et28A]EOA81629.1 hypothetical protein SETTUDRAFT_99171 [Exserohilum turcica Et28A]